MIPQKKYTFLAQNLKKLVIKELNEIQENPHKHIFLKRTKQKYWK